jgi:hypothetical protein
MPINEQDLLHRLAGLSLAFHNGSLEDHPEVAAVVEAHYPPKPDWTGPLADPQRTAFSRYRQQVWASAVSTAQALRDGHGWSFNRLKEERGMFSLSELRELLAAMPTSPSDWIPLDHLTALAEAARAHYPWGKDTDYWEEKRLAAIHGMISNEAIMQGAKTDDMIDWLADNGCPPELIAKLRDGSWVESDE